MVKYESQTLDAVFSALADPTRRAILELLAGRECTVSEIAEPHTMSLPAISKHLKVLHEAGLVELSREGRFRRCALNGKPLAKAADWLSQYRAFWEKRFDKLETVLSAHAATVSKHSKRRTS